MSTHFQGLQKVSIVIALIGASAFIARPAASDRIPQSSPKLLPNADRKVSPKLLPNPGEALPNPVPLPFKVLSAPNPNLKWTTMGILIAPENSAQAAGFARYAAVQLTKTGSWARISVFVFTDPAAAADFKRFQVPRRGSPLRKADFGKLTSVWQKTQVYHEKKNRSERASYPGKNPSKWWKPLFSSPGYLLAE